MRGGLRPGLLSDAGWWQTPLWQHRVFAVVIYSGAVAKRAGGAGGEIVRRIFARHGLDFSA